MTREAILDEIRHLERQKVKNPAMSGPLNAQISTLCDKLKAIRPFEPRKVV